MNKKLFMTLVALVAATASLQATIITSGDETYIRSGAADSNLNGEDRILIGFHNSGHLKAMRGVFEFDLTSVTEPIDSISLTLNRESFTSGDQESGQFDLLLKNLNTDFDETSVTWNTFSPSGGDVSGTTLSTVDAYNASTITSATFNSTTDFLNAANASAGGIFRVIVYSPGAEGLAGTGTSSDIKSFYRFTDSASLEYSVIPEPSSFAMILIGFAACIMVYRRRA
ncbi:MAG: DNRLRE domain-containing protein [Kiritimatiellia bacterium]